MFFSQLLLAFRCRLGKGFFCLQLSCIKTFSLCICVSEVEARGGRQGADSVPVILWYKLKKLVNTWLRTPPLTEPE